MKQRLQNLPRGKRQLSALILAPTRELALQVSTHFACLVDFGTTSGDSTGKVDKPGEGSASTHKQPPIVSVATIVGGMSAQKQRRILDRGVDILVATPGRFWDLLEEAMVFYPMKIDRLT
jgi:ATP-dependent RNA helicase DDX24/MAK5